MNTITNYTIKTELGQGGMATVYLAEHKTLGLPVAVKVLAKEFAHNENIRKRFLAEARNMFKMSHPNIIKVSDLIEEGDTVAFVMEYIEGDTLKDYLERKGKLNDDEIKTIFTQMLAAVGYVHEQGLIHRDIKPSNFMINPKGQVKLLDFGIAKNTDTNSAEYTQTSTSQQMGTPMYMSPEQVKETKSVTAQSDIYSLGVVLWQMVMGQKPYDTKTLSNFELQLKIVQEPLALTQTIWDTSIQKATHKSLDSRYTSAQLFLNDLQNPESIKDDKTIFEKTDDKTILENKEEATVIENNISKEIECPRCLGKGEVDWKDIKRLNRLNDWGPGPCAYCDQDGTVLESKVLQVAPDDVNLVFEEFDLADGFFGGHISNLEDYIDAITDSFENDFDNVDFNGEFKDFKKNGWDEFDESILDELFVLPKEFERNVKIICQYMKEDKGWFSSKIITVLFGVYSKNYIQKKDKNGDYYIDDCHVTGNLLWIIIDDNCWGYSLSCSIDEHRDLTCVSEITVTDNKLCIDSYKDGAGETDSFYDELTLDKKINSVILNLWNKIQITEEGLEL